MATVQLLAPQAGALTNAAALQVDYANYERVTFFADNLATTETAVVSILTPSGTFIPAPDVNGVVTGLSATNPARQFFGGLPYVVNKSATAGACGLWYAPVGKSA